MSPRENAFYEIAKCFGLLINTEIMAKRSVNSFSEGCFKFEKFRSTKTLECELNRDFLLKRVFVPLIGGDYEVIMAHSEGRIECKLREKLLFPFAIHINKKDYESNDKDSHKY